MIRRSYTNFVSLFGYLNPYELDHISGALQIKLEEVLYQRSGTGEVMPFNVQDIKQAMTKGMRDVKLELAENEVKKAHIRFRSARNKIDRARADTFTPKQILSPNTAKSGSNRQARKAA